ncbi:hypothetical protein [Caenispirillum salinarum]|uniref:hypothetical protein n=1 Tax=Caenispirillum salinarum TaxID=859058 RepID=UPI00384BA12A
MPGRSGGGSGATPLTVGPVLVWLSLAAVAIIIAGIVGHVLEVRDTTRAAAQTQARTAAQLLAENTARLMDSADFLLDDVADRVQARPWADIASDAALWRGMAADAERFEHVEAVWLNNADGELRQVSLRFPSPASNASDRDFFRHFAEGGAGPFISEPIIGRVTKKPTFLLTRALTAPDTGAFRGIVSVTLDAAYFSSFLETFALPYDASIMLVRAADGRVLVSEPEARTGRVVSAPLLERVERGVSVGAFQDADTIGWMRRLPEWPVYAVVRFDGRAIDAEWRDSVVNYVVIGGLALIALIGLAGYARAVERSVRD